MANITGNLTAFNVGIERILSTDAGEARSSRLPDGVSSPSGLVVQKHLEKAVDSPSLDRALLAALRPDIKDPSLLMPARFNTRMRELAKKLREREGRGGGRQDDADAREERLARLADLLAEDENLRNLLSAYRGLLLGG